MKELDTEHLAFEEFATKQGLDRTMHPLHLLYLDSDTHSALKTFQAGYQAAGSPKPIEDDRKVILLRAARDILRKCERSGYVQDVMTVTAVWDEADCDGYCLLGEIEDELRELEGVAE